MQFCCNSLPKIAFQKNITLREDMMVRHQYFMIGCLVTMSVVLMASVDKKSISHLIGYKTKIMQEVGKALAKSVPVSPLARYKHSRPKTVNTPCGCVTLITPHDINPNGCVITRPGLYNLEKNAQFNPSAPNLSAIVIDSDNVTLNLCGRTLSNSGSQAGTVGILVNGRTNVVIQGGTVTGFNLYGIRLNGQSSYVTLKDLAVVSNGAANTLGGGISISSSDATAITHDIVIDQVNASGNIFNGLSLGGVNDVVIVDSKFNNTQGTVSPFGVSSWGVFGTALPFGGFSGIPNNNISISNSEASNGTSLGGAIGIEFLSVNGFALNSNITITRCITNNNRGGGDPLAINEGEGIVLDGVQNFLVKDCVSSGNGMNSIIGPSGISGLYASTGFGLPFYCSNGRFENCTAQGNFGNGDVSDGFRIIRSTSITLDHCVAVGNYNTSAGEAWGFTTDPDLGNDLGIFGAPVGTGYVITNCLADSNFSQEGICGGFKFISQVNSTLSNSTSVSNGSNGNGYGILVGDPACCITNTCCALDPVVCQDGSGNCLPASACCPTKNNVINNNQVVGNSLYGIFDQSNSNANNAYYANVARGNGTNYAYQVGLVVAPNALPGAPIRNWPLPSLPATTDNNGVLDAQLDNISITP